jgi:glycosyltransferase involved in cell wall biosynthesis
VTAAASVHVIVPYGVDDPTRPSGGNAYDRHVCNGLAACGWSVREHVVPGTWPRPDGASYAALADVIGHIPDGAVVLLDGLIACMAPEVLVPAADRLRLVVLVHMPFGDRMEDDVPDDAERREREVLSAAAGVVATSAWTRARLLALYGLPVDHVQVAEPGVASAGLADGTPGGGSLICVAAVIPRKGQDVLVEALAQLTDLSWQCVFVGTTERDPTFVDRLRRRARVGGFEDRVSFAGPRTGADLDRTYAAADLLLLPSHGEAYGMVVTEALARGLPVIATDAGGLPEALGHGADGCSRPGLLVPPGDTSALVTALRSWLVDDRLREQLRRTALERRAGLAGWSDTISTVAGALAGAAR